MNTEYWEALDAFLDREMEPQKAAEMGLLAAQVAPFGAYIRDALAIRAAFPGVGDVSVPTGFAESVLAALPEQTGGAADAAENPEDKPGVSRKSEAARSPEAEEEREAARSPEAEEEREDARIPEAEEEREDARIPEAEEEREAARIPEAEEEREAARIPEAEEDREATREVDTRAIVDGVARLAAAYEREGKVAGVPDWDSGPDRADDLNQANGRTDGWQEKWKKAALPLAACMALVLLVAGGFALSRGGGTPPAADNSNKDAFVTAASDGTESPSISLGAGAAEFRRMEEYGEEEAALQDAKDAAADAGGEESAPAEAEAAKEEAPPTPAPTEAPRQPSPTPSPKPSPTPTPTPTPTPVPTPTEAPPTPTPEPEPDPAANLPARNGAGEEPQSAQDAGDENPWDNVELTLPDDAGYLFERYTPLEEETGGALYAFSREQYAALLDALDAAGFITHTSMPSESATIYVYLETESAGDWEEGAEEGSEGEAETEPDFDPEEGGETEDGETGSAASGSSEVEDFARR